jgi:hypothetical protein
LNGPAAIPSRYYAIARNRTRIAGKESVGHLEPERRAGSLPCTTLLNTLGDFPGIP